MADPVLFIAGLGRCGTTMVMRMLDHGGVPVAGERPAYEPTQMKMSTPTEIRSIWADNQGGKAMKWMDPMNAYLDYWFWRNRPVGFLLLRRDPEHQAKSMAKLVGMHRPSKSEIATIAQSIRQDQRMLEAFLDTKGNVYSASFEWILKEPGAFASKLDAITDAVLGLRLDTAKAAAAVIRRTPWCAPGLAIEMRLYAEENENG